jgi:cysteine-rich repeat protein
MFVNDWSDVGPSDQGLDYTLFPNQHARVDIMSAAAGPFDTGAGVLANVYLGVDGGPDPHAYTPYVIDITAAVAGGGTFVVRFAEAQNQFYQNLGVDNVSIDATLCNADGVIDVGEECDDGNSMNGDGCSQGCRIEPCHTCAGAPSVCPAVPDGTSCDDQLFCNGTDTCLTATHRACGRSVCRRNGMQQQATRAPTVAPSPQPPRAPTTATSARATSHGAGVCRISADGAL